MKTTVSTFSTFPEFTKLTLSDCDKYNELIKDYPAISGISFPELSVWWSVIDPCKISQLNNNLVISYWMPGDEINSGLSLIGTNKIDESICTLFDYLKEQDKHPKLVHVPEFVISNISYPELFCITSEHESDECILSTKRLTSINKMPKNKAKKIEQFFKSAQAQEVTVKSLDLNKIQNQELLIDAAKKWKTGTFNFVAKHESQCLEQSIWYANDLGLENVCIYFNGKIQSYLMYQTASNKKYAIISYGRFSYENPNMFEFATYEYAKWFLKKGFEYVNIQEDLGDAILRATKVNMGPTNYFRKYTIEPRDR